jgi:hypothetical protein
VGAAAGEVRSPLPMSEGCLVLEREKSVVPIGLTL